jgi:UPF0271 protein
VGQNGWMFRVDLNCDMGEGAGHDAELMPLITSANIACGAHSGNARTMAETCELAEQHGVSIGAHPGLDDRANFGRRELPISQAAAAALVTRQLRALSAHGKVRHVKPHGALYNMATRDPALAEAIAVAIRQFDASLVLFGLAHSALTGAGEALGLTVAHEVFADRTYQSDGSLTPRSQPDALLTSPQLAAAQAVRMVRAGHVRATDGTEVAVKADTICLHGDGPHAVEFARAIRQAFERTEIVVMRFAP